MRKALAGVALALVATAVTAGYEEGVVAYYRSDYQTALREWQPLAEQGHAEAQFNVGVMYERGEGVPEDDSAAASWFERAAQQGNTDAQVALGVMYDQGRGLPEDNAVAMYWYRRAAQEGVAAAQYNLGTMYGRGDGVQRDLVTAVGWLSLAEAQGHEQAKRNADVLRAQMTPDQVARAEALSQELATLPAGPAPAQALPPVAAVDDAPAATVASGPAPKRQPIPQGRALLMETQIRLSMKGYDVGTTDGLMGRQTRDAIRAFQQDLGLPPSGRPSAELLLLLRTN